MRYFTCFVVLVALGFLPSVPEVSGQAPFAPEGNAQSTSEQGTPRNTGRSFTSPMGNTIAPVLALPERRPGTGNDAPSLSPQDIASGGKTDTPSASIIGTLKNPKVEMTHSIPSAASDALSALGKGMSSLSGEGLKVSIVPTLPSETSQSLSQLVSPLTWWVFLLMGQSATTLAGRLWPWVAPVGNGLRFVATAALSAMGFKRDAGPA